MFVFVRKSKVSSRDVPRPRSRLAKTERLDLGAFLVSSAKICRRVGLEIFFKGHKCLRTYGIGKFFLNYDHVFFYLKLFI